MHNCLLSVSLMFCLFLFSCKVQSRKSIPPPPPPSSQSVTSEMWGITEVMPRFPYDTATCEAPPKECSEEALLTFIYENLNYNNIVFPAEIGEKNAAVVSFIIEKTGEVKDIRLVRDLPHIEGAGDEALRLIRLMRDEIDPWEPGTQSGKKVRVQYNLPIKFTRDQQ